MSSINGADHIKTWRFLHCGKLLNQNSKRDFIVSNKAQSIEHSIEALIPFLQYYNRDLKITPIMVTQMPFERMDELR